MIESHQPTSEKIGEPSLEARLKEAPHPEMDLMQFLVIAGFNYKWEPLQASENEKLGMEVYDRYFVRRSKLSTKTKKLETRIWYALFNAHDDKVWPTKTINDLKYFIEERRAGKKVDIYNIDFVSIAYLNKAFRYYGLEEINFDVTSTGVKERIAKLEPYHPPTSEDHKLSVEGTD